jgi:hypothetical protein
MKHSRTALLVLFVLAAAFTRVVQHPLNFAPITAMALFGAAHFSRRWLAFLAPLLALLVSDLALEVISRTGLYNRVPWLVHRQGLYAGMGVVYGTMALITLLGFVLRKHRSVPAIGLTTLAGSIIFFLVTNFACWPGSTEYPQTAWGLVLCYWAGVPFFKWTLLGDFCYVALFFGGFALVEKCVPALAEPSPA